MYSHGGGGVWSLVTGAADKRQDTHLEKHGCIVSNYSFKQVYKITSLFHAIAIST